MTRQELVRLAVLMTISDAYEEPLHVYGCVARALECCGIAVVLEETQRALIELTEPGLPKAYKLSPPAEELRGIRSDDYYFWITEEGLRSLAAGRSRKDWPLDDVHDLIPGWPGLSE